MASIDISRVIPTKREVCPDTVFQFVKTKLGEATKITKADVLTNKMSIERRIRPKVWSRMVAF